MATRDIRKDEEVTISYGWKSSTLSEFKFDCRCQDEACKKYIQFDVADSDDVLLIEPESPGLQSSVDINDLEGNEVEVAGIEISGNRSSSDLQKSTSSVSDIRLDDVAFMNEDDASISISNVNNVFEENGERESNIVDDANICKEVEKVIKEKNINDDLAAKIIEGVEVVARESHSVCSNSNESIYHDTSVIGDKIDVISKSQLVQGSRSVSTPSRSVNNNNSTSLQAADQDLRLRKEFLKLQSLLFVHSNVYNYEAVMSHINITCNIVERINNVPLLEWDGIGVKEEGGICNAPPKQKKNSICYFSAAVQLMFRSFSHSMKKRLFLYDLSTNVGDIDNMMKVLEIAADLFKGKNIPYDVKTSARLATKATVDKDGTTDKHFCSKGQEKYLDATDSVLWMCNTIFSPETNITTTYVTEETGLIEIVKSNCLLLDGFGRKISMRLLLDEYMASLCRKDEQNRSKKVDVEVSSKFLLIINGDESIVDDAYYVSWKNEGNSNVIYGIIRGFIYYSNSHYITYIRSLKGNQDRWICYDDDDVCLNAKEAMFLSRRGRVYIYESCDEKEYYDFINSMDGLVQCHSTMKRDIEVLCTFISSILNFDKKMKKKNLVFYKYIDIIFGFDSIASRGDFIINELRSHMQTYMVVKPSEDVIQSILLFYKNKSTNIASIDGAKFIISLEKEMVKEVVQPYLSFDTLLLPEVVVESIANNIWSSIME